MFPAPIQQATRTTQWLYRVALPISLLLWLLPLLAVVATSVRGAGDLNAGNYWGWPSEWKIAENYAAVFE
ncbi:MAG TPA: hypothetical protein VNM90_14245, partial [Haliangium sp.]|nr:hypothetical protein [Haliangium sp.]